MDDRKYFLGVVRKNTGILLLCRYFFEESILVNAVTNENVNTDDLSSSEFNALHEQPAVFRGNE